MDTMRSRNQKTVISLQEVFIKGSPACRFPEQTVALQQKLFIQPQVFEVFLLAERDAHIQKAPSLFAPPVDHHHIIGCYDDHRIATHKLRHACDSHLIDGNALAFAAFVYREHPVFFLPQPDFPGETKKGRPESDILAIPRIEIALTAAEKMQGIEEVGLAGSVGPGKAGDLRFKSKLGPGIAFEISKLKRVDEQWVFPFNFIFLRQ